MKMILFSKNWKKFETFWKSKLLPSFQNTPKIGHNKNITHTKVQIDVIYTNSILFFAKNNIKRKKVKLSRFVNVKCAERFSNNENQYENFIWGA